MTSKLYLIESEEREGLVKIGFAGERNNEQSTEADIVYTRVSEYATGISDVSKVHETNGSIIFEKYLQSFFKNKNKAVVIEFLSNVRKPREWFMLEPDVLEVLIQSFANEHPRTFEGVKKDELPVFLSGVFSAIDWEAKYISPERIAQIAGIAAQERFAVAFGGKRQSYYDHTGSVPHSSDMTLQGGSDASAESESDLISERESMLSEHDYNLVQYAMDSIGRVKAMDVELTQIKVAQAGQIIIGGASIFCVLFLALFQTGVWGIAIFSTLSFSILIAWPFVSPYLSVFSNRLLKRLQNSLAGSRQKAGKHDER